MILNNKIKIGFFFVAGITLLTFGINFLKKQPLFGKETVYFVKYHHLDGLREKTPIYVKGFVVGTVDEISFSSENGHVEFLIKLVLYDALTVPSGTVAEISSKDLITGTKTIDLAWGNGKTNIPSYDTLPGAVFTSLNDQIEDFKLKTLRTIHKLDSSVEILNHIVVEDIATTLGQTLRNTSSFTKMIDSLIKENFNEISSSIAASSQIMKNLNRQQATVNRFIKNMEMVSAEMENAPIDSILDGMNRIMQAINNQEGSAGAFIYDTMLYHSLVHLSGSLDTLVNDFKEQPSKYVNVSVFGGGKERKKKGKKK